MGIPSHLFSSWRLTRSVTPAISTSSNPPHSKTSGRNYPYSAHLNTAMAISSGSGFLSCSWTSFLPCFSGALHNSTASSSTLTSTLTAQCSSSSSQCQPEAESGPSKGILNASDRIKGLFAACEGAFGSGRDPSDEQLKNVQQALGAS